MEEERISQLGKSETVIEQNIKSLKQLFPQVFTEDKINFSLLEDLLGEKIEDRKEYYELSWAGKSDARKELSKSTVATLTPDREKSVDFDNTQNLFIEGENLEVLRTLQKSYFGKIKMIYIDPPYNTGNDSFVYPDNYSETKKEYEKRIGKVDEEGYINKVELWKQNSKENGQYHSVWLSMMYSRLSYAHSLLSDDGVIFISIDDNEQANLKLLCDSVFGEDSFIGQFIWQKKTQPSFLSKEISIITEYLLCYKKNTNIIPLKGGLTDSERDGELINIGNPIAERVLNKSSVEIERGKYDGILKKGMYGNGVLTIELLEDVIVNLGKPQTDIKLKGRFIRSQETLNIDIQNGANIFIRSTDSLRPTINFNRTESNIKPPISLLSKKLNNNIPTNTDASSEIKNLFNGINIMDYPKPSKLIKFIIESVTYNHKNSIILDFFAGSCTTGHAIMELNKEDGGNRKFICVQMPEKTDKKSEAYKQGYEKISDIGAERLRRAGKRIKEEIEKEIKENDGKLLDKKEIKDIDTGFKYYRLTPSHFKVWQNDINENELGKQLDAFIDATKEGSKEEEMLYELILKSGFSLTTPIEKNSKGFYYIKEWQTCIALENFNKETIESIFELKPKEVITLDKFFENNDSLLSNTRLEFKDKEIILTII